MMFVFFVFSADVRHAESVKVDNLITVKLSRVIC